ncbi:MAG: hypothetical protein ACLTFC_01435 [Pilosibacter sp.]
MEYDYREYRKDSQAVLREKNSRREKMDHFLSSEERKKEGREPEKKLEIGNSYGTFEIGFSKAAAKKNREDVQKAPEKLAVISGLRKDRRKELRDYEYVRENGAVPLPLLKKRAFVNSHVKEKSAAALKLDQEKTGSRLTESLSAMRNQGKLETVQEMLPFLDSEREKEERAQLLEEQRTVGKLSTVKNQYLDQLKENELHKQREKERFIQSVDKILKNRSEELRAEKRVHNGSLEEYLKKVWKNVLTKDAEKDGDIENNGEKEGFV